MRRPGASRGGGIEPGRQRPAKIDGRSRQNPAYRPGHFSRKGNSFRLFSFFFSLLAGRRGAFCWGLFLISLRFLIIFTFPFDALGPRGGPYFLPLQKVGKDRRKGVSPPCESPDQSGVLDAPLWKPPSLAAIRIGRTPRRFAAGASVPLGKAAEPRTRSTARAPATFPFTLGARESPREARARCGGRGGAHGNAFPNCAEAPAAQRLGVPPLPAPANCVRSTRQRDRRGIPRGRSSLAPVFAYFLLARK